MIKPCPRRPLRNRPSSRTTSQTHFSGCTVRQKENTRMIRAPNFLAMKKRPLRQPRLVFKSVLRSEHIVLKPAVHGRRIRQQTFEQRRCD